MILNIGHVQSIFMQRKTLRMIKRRDVIATVLPPDGTGTNNILNVTFEIRNDNPIVATICDK